eukprot:jgi/Ulvmu1/10115/UM006_0066.1
MTRATLDTSNVLRKPYGSRCLDEDYELGAILGKGAFATVREAVHRLTGESLACKSIPKAKLVYPKDVKDVQREVAIINHVSGHAHVVSYRASYEDRDAVHIVMERCEGGALLDSIVECRHYTERKAAAVFRAMVETTHHCHELGVMHRDLKPENFLLTSRDSDIADVKAIDFGVSTFCKPNQHLEERVGSAYYIAPEVLRKDYTFRADLWSLGVILYILLSGLPPFWGDERGSGTERQVFQMILAGDVDLDSEPWPSISHAAKDLVRRLLSVDPGARPSCSEILQHAWLKQEGAGSDRPLGNVVLSRMKRFAGIHQLKKTALMVVGTCLSADEIAGMKRLFRTIDHDHNGKITVSELQYAIKLWGHRIPPSEVTAILTAADVDGDGEIDYNEFVASTMNINQLEKEEVIWRAFAELDADGSGSISAPELECALQRFGIQDDVHDLLQAADTNGDGQIDYQEFVQLMRETNAELADATSDGGFLLRRTITPGLAQHAV